MLNNAAQKHNYVAFSLNTFCLGTVFFVPFCDCHTRLPLGIVLKAVLFRDFCLWHSSSPANGAARPSNSNELERKKTNAQKMHFAAFVGPAPRA